MAKKKGTGCNSKVAEKAYDKSVHQVNEIVKKINDLHDHLVDLNNDGWSGGAIGCSWYKGMAERYTLLLQFVSGIRGFNNDLSTVFKKHKITSNANLGL